MDSRIKNLEKHEYIKENDEFLKKGEGEKTVINSKKNKVLYDCHGPVIKQTNRQNGFRQLKEVIYLNLMLRKFSYT